MDTPMPFLSAGQAIIGMIVFASTAMAVLLVATEVAKRWTEYLEKYATQLSRELDFLFVDMDKRTAKILLQLIIFGAFFVGFILSGGAIMFSLAFAIIGMLVPRGLLKVAHDWRLDMFDVQLIDVVTMIKNSLKSGLGLQQAFEMVANEFAAPANQEFALVLKEIRMGLDMDEALENLNKRIPNPELEMVITSIVTLRKTGGNMVETFELIAFTIKERRKVEGKIKALTAQGKMQTRILLAMPFFMAGILTFMDPKFMSPLFNTLIGWIFLTLIGMLMTMGYVVIKKLTTIEI